MRAWLILPLLLCACSPAAGEGAAPAQSPAASPSGAIHPESGLRVIPLTVSFAGKRHDFMVEVASSGAEQAKGLMFRKAMGADEGMLFPMEPPRQASFWMKNTVIPLDIIFIGPDRLVSNVAANATPYSLDPLPSAGVAAAVLEINGGRAAELGIVPGAKVEW